MPSACRALAQERAQPANALRVEAVQGLVQNQDLRVAEQRRPEPEPLAHARRVLADPAAGGLLEPDDREHFVDAGARQPGQCRERAQVVARRAAGMGAARLDVDAEHAGVRRHRVDRRPVDQRPARSRTGKPDDRLERRGLAGAVRSEEARDRARPHGERQLLDRRHVAIALRQVLDRDRRRYLGCESGFHGDMIRGVSLAVIGSADRTSSSTQVGRRRPRISDLR